MPMTETTPSLIERLREASALLQDNSMSATDASDLIDEAADVLNRIGNGRFIKKKPPLPKEVNDAAYNLSVSISNHEEVFADLCNFAIEVINAKTN